MLKRKNIISVGIPVYGQKIYLRQCLKSLAKNVSLEMELIIVDDCSKENIKTEVEAFISKQKPKNILKVVFIRNNNNMGFPHNANIILNNSKEKIICILNSDTYVCPNAFERIVKLMNSDNKIIIAGPTTSQANSNQEIYEFSKERFISEKEILKKGESIEKRFRNNILELSQRETNSQIQGFCFFIKKEAIKRIGYFDEIYGLGTYEESDYNSRADFLGHKAVWVKKAYVHHFGQRSWSIRQKVKFLYSCKKNEAVWLKKMKCLNSNNIKKVKRFKNSFIKEILYEK
ncbi:MAG: glycosyltransferase [Patescibacteria group bacterium]|nr:glycosyltransferase [Patescibacteria group bacterium]